MLVVLAAFFPHLIGEAVRSFSDAAGLGSGGDATIEGQVSEDQVRAQTGLVGIAITLFSATSFARAIQRMYEKVWEQRHIGGVSGTRRCFVWLLGWLVTLQLVGGLRTLMGGVDGMVGVGARLGVQMLLLSLLWLVTSWVLLFGRVGWRRLALGALLTGCLGVLYNRASGAFMPPYVDANAEQFGTLGIILAVSTWLIGFAGIMVASALVGRVVSEDPTVLRVVRSCLDFLESVRARLRRRPVDEPAAR
jgi:membrane protein